MRHPEGKAVSFRLELIFRLSFLFAPRRLWSQRPGGAILDPFRSRAALKLVSDASRSYRANLYWFRSGDQISAIVASSGFSPEAFQDGGIASAVLYTGTRDEEYACRLLDFIDSCLHRAQLPRTIQVGRGQTDPIGVHDNGLRCLHLLTQPTEIEEAHRRLLDLFREATRRPSRQCSSDESSWFHDAVFQVKTRIIEREDRYVFHLQDLQQTPMPCELRLEVSVRKACLASKLQSPA